jgi:hypothetical protein
MEGLQGKLIPWVDPFHSYNYHNVKYDLPSGVLRSELFGTVQHWPPPVFDNSTTESSPTKSTNVPTTA